MLIHSFKHFRDFLHAQLCYQLFITPMYLPLKKEHRDFAKKGCEFIEVKRSEVIHQEFPRHHVLHRFAQINNPQAKIDPTLTRLHHFLAQAPPIPFLCIHGELDNTVSPEESLFFCKAYKYGNCALLPDADHLSVLIDERVEQLVNDFLS